MNPNCDCMCSPFILALFSLSLSLTSLSMRGVSLNSWMLGRLERFFEWLLCALATAIAFIQCSLSFYFFAPVSLFFASCTMEHTLYMDHHSRQLVSFVNRLLRSILYDDRAYFAIFHLALLLPRINFECISFFSFRLARFISVSLMQLVRTSIQLA